MRKYTKSQLAEKLYNQKLKDIEDTVMKKNNTTFLKELDGIGNKLFGVRYKGTFPSDKIPRLNDLSPYCILNLDRSDEPGSHWIALVKDVHNDRCLVYDSFGRTHTKIIPNLRFSGNGRVIDTDKDKEQHPKETNCGQRCLSFLAIYDKWGYDVAKLI
jgi:hypothetical protein